MSARHVHPPCEECMKQANADRRVEQTRKNTAWYREAQERTDEKEPA